MRRSILLAIMLVISVTAAYAMVEEEASAQSEKPVITGLHILNVHENSFEIEWETNTPTKCTVEWGRTKEYGESKEIGGPYETSFRTNVTGLKRTTKYHFRVVAENLASEVGFSNDRTVTTGPQDEVEGGTPGWVWGLLSVAIIVLLVYLFLLRPISQG